MRIALLYVCVTHGKRTMELASRFVGTYLLFRPEVHHDTVIICNGGPLPTELGLVFSSLNCPMFWPRKNDGGWDISAYLEAARGLCRDYDLLLCMGESCYFHRAGWLRRILDVWTEHGPGFYGFFGSNNVRSHLQTSAFVTSPALLTYWLRPVLNKRDRYEFEHGTKALWRILAKRKVPVRQINWDTDVEPAQWRDPHDILWRGNQSNCLFFSNHTDAWAAADTARKQRWSQHADSVFR